jgi:hypothetical protein
MKLLIILKKHKKNTLASRVQQTRKVYLFLADSKAMVRVNKIAQQEKLKEYEKLKEADKMKTGFIKLAAHELRIPIRPI